MGPQIGKGHTIGEGVLHQLGRGCREQDLSAVPGSGDTGSPVDIHPDVAVGHRGGGPGVQPHPHPDRYVVWPLVARQTPLGRNRCQRRAASGGEDGEERVPLDAYHCPVPGVDGVPQDAPVLCEERAVVVAEGIEQTSGPLDVGEEKGDGAGGARPKSGGRIPVRLHPAVLVCLDSHPRPRPHWALDWPYRPSPCSAYPARHHTEAGFAHLPPSDAYRDMVSPTPVEQPNTLGELEDSGWADRTVKEELRHNLVERLRTGADLFPGIVGFGDTVIPALERAILAGHDIILLGERGQAKTRLIRRLVELLDPEIPVIAGTELNDSPLRPVSVEGRRILAERGKETPIAWLPRERRFAEKLATPDTSVADLIGDIDPIRVAEGRYLSDEHTIHFGLVPRTNRGIFSINELPDLPARIQVALLNVLEERDIQVRGFTIRLPLDVMLVASANPEDYTNRGRIITPLKDRFGSEIRTHYPRERADEIEIMQQEARPPAPEVPITVPDVLEDVLAEFTRQVRASSHVNQRSGVSVRFTIANKETMVASSIRRALRTGEGVAVPRVSDLPSTVQSSMGRVEFEVFEEGREAEILRRLLASAVLEIFRERLSGFDFRPWLEQFEEGLEVTSGDLVGSDEMLRQAEPMGDITPLLQRLGVQAESPAHTASALEFALEGLHLTRRLNKTTTAGGARYGG